MTGFTVFLLVLFGFIGVVLFVSNPFLRLGKLLEGKTANQLTAEAEEWLDRVGPGKACMSGCGYLLYFLVGLLYGFVIEPLVVILAVVNDVGNPIIAYVMGGIILVSWLEQVVVAIRKQLRGNKEPDPDEILLKSYGGMIFWVRRLIYFLPTLYLWYLAGVGLRLLQ